MVHTFCVDGRYLALDVDSGTVHLLDEMSYEVISRWERKLPSKSLASFPADLTKKS